MNDTLVVCGVLCIITGLYFITPPAALVALGAILLVIGLIRMRGTDGPR